MGLNDLIALDSWNLLHEAGELVGGNGAAVGEREAVDHSSLNGIHQGKSSATRAWCVVRNSHVTNRIADKGHGIGMQVRDHNLTGLTGIHRFPIPKEFHNETIRIEVIAGLRGAFPRDPSAFDAAVTVNQGGGKGFGDKVPCRGVE